MVTGIKIKNSLALFVLLLILLACNQSKYWAKDRSISLGASAPIGLAQLGDKIWVADGDNNQLIALEGEKVVEKLEGFERPMHIASSNNSLYIPEYGTDQIIQLSNGKRGKVLLKDSLDAPAGIAVFGQEMAIADFYNHRVLYFNGNTWKAIGKKGKAEGEFHYPTDVQIIADKIYVADAYNNRVQVFDKKGGFLQFIGVEEKMNAATGIYVSDQEVMITDFEHDRVLVYDLNGQLKQIIKDELSKPTDILLVDDELWITNYKSKSIDIYKR